MSSELIWYATAGPGSHNSEKGAVVQAEYIFKDDYTDLGSLQEHIAKSASLPAPANEIGIWMIRNQSEWPVYQVNGKTVTLPTDEEDLPKIADRIGNLDILLNNTRQTACLHFISWISDITAETREKLVALNRNLFDAIALNVHSYGSWSEDDVLNNEAKFDTVQQISEFQKIINRPRAHDATLLTNIEAKHFVEALKLQFMEIKGRKDADEFGHYFVQRTTQAATQSAVRGPAEFENFSCMSTVCKDFDFDSKEKGRHSEEEAGHFCTFFVQRPCRSLRRDNRGYKYSQGLHWPFSIYLEYEEIQDNNKRKRDTKKYNPKSDFRVDGLHGFPQLIGEVVSDPKYSDKWRMLLQSIAIVRAVAHSDLSDDFFVMAIYVDDKYVAWRYLVYKIKGGKDIYLALREFDLKIVMQCRRLLLEIYNFLDYIRGFGKGKGKAPLLSKVKDELKDLNTAGLKLKSLHSKNSKGSGSKASRKE